MAGIFDGRIQLSAQGPYGTSAMWGMTRSTGARQGDKWHGGVDVICPDQPADATSVYAVEGGRVTQSRIVNNGAGAGTAEWGNYVTVQGSATGKYHIYAHLASRAVQAGQTVKAGDKLGVMGNTGNAAGGYKHVHFEVRDTISGKGIDPTPYLGIKNAVGVYGAASDNTNTGGNSMARLRAFQVDGSKGAETASMVRDPARAGMTWVDENSRVMLKSVWAAGEETTASNISIQMDQLEAAGYGKPGIVAFITED